MFHPVFFLRKIIYRFLSPYIGTIIAIFPPIHRGKAEMELSCQLFITHNQLCSTLYYFWRKSIPYTSSKSLYIITNVIIYTHLYLIIIPKKNPLSNQWIRLHYLVSYIPIFHHQKPSLTINSSLVPYFDN